MLILIKVKVNLVFYVCTRYLSFCMKELFVVGSFFPSPWLFLFLSCYGLWPILNILFPTTNLCACHNIYNLYFHSFCEREWSAVNNQLFGHSWCPRKVLLMRKNLEGPVDNKTVSAFVTFSFINVGCWELICFIRETRLTRKSHSKIWLIKKINVIYYYNIWYRIWRTHFKETSSSKDKILF